MNCPDHVVDPSLQLRDGGSTGPYDCTAHSASNAIDGSTCGAKDPGGRVIRLMSNEDVPNWASPGLNLWQVQDVAAELGVTLTVYVGSKALTWAQYEAKRKSGQHGIIQVRYASIADSKYNAGRGFRGNHALSENHASTFDPLADGRAAGVWKHNGSLYQRDVIRSAAEQLDIGGGLRPGRDNVWCAFGPDIISNTVPSWFARVPAGDFWAYYVLSSGLIRYRRVRTTGGFSATATTPRSHRWEADRTRTSTLVRLASGSKAGMYISANYATEK